MLRTAIISLNRDCDATGGVAGLLPLFGQTVVERQIAFARRSGAGTVYLLGPRHQATDQLAAANEDVVTIRDLGEIDPRTVMHQLLLVADGALANADFADQLREIERPTIFAVGSVPGKPAVEPIDLHRQWSGIALADGAMLNDREDLPPDWDQFSALFRQAMQSGPRIETIADDQLDDAGWVTITEIGNALDYQSWTLEQCAVRDDAPFSERLLSPLLRKLQPILWSRKVPDAWLRISQWLLTGGAASAALMGWTVASLAALLLAALIQLLLAQGSAARRLGPNAKSRLKPMPVVWLLIVLMLCVTTSDPIASIPLLLISAGLGCGLSALHQADHPAWVTRVRPDVAILLAIGVISAALAGFPISLYIVSAIVLLIGAFALLLPREDEVIG